MKNVTVKTYSSKANARRAAKSAKLDLDTLDFEKGEDGKFFWKEKLNAEDKFLLEAYGEVNCPGCGVHLSNGAQTHSNLRADDKPGCEEFENVCLACDHEFGPAIKKHPKRVVKNHSSVTNPCLLVHNICDEMCGQPGIKRKDVIAACVEQGVAYYTARTQYQNWLVASRGETKA